MENVATGFVGELQMVLNLLGDLGIYAVWVALGFIIYKLLTLASYLMLVKYFITRVYQLIFKGIDRVKVNRTTLRMDKYMIDCEANASHLHAVLMSLRIGSRYIHDVDITWLEKAIKTQRTIDDLNAVKTVEVNNLLK